MKKIKRKLLNLFWFAKHNAFEKPDVWLRSDSLWKRLNVIEHWLKLKTFNGIFTLKIILFKISLLVIYYIVVCIHIVEGKIRIQSEALENAFSAGGWEEDGGFSNPNTFISSFGYWFSFLHNSFKINSFGTLDGCIEHLLGSQLVGLFSITFWTCKITCTFLWIFFRFWCYWTLDSPVKIRTKITIYRTNRKFRASSRARVHGSFYCERKKLCAKTKTKRRFIFYSSNTNTRKFLWIFFWRVSINSWLWFLDLNWSRRAVSHCHIYLHFNFTTHTLTYFIKESLTRP